MNKKGGIIIPLVTICAILLLLVAAFSIFSGEKKPGTEKIGELQLEIIGYQQEAEGKLFYLDQLVKYSAKKTSEELKNKIFVSESAFLEAFSKKFESDFKLEVVFFDAPSDYKFEYEYNDYIVKIKGDAKKEIVLGRDPVIYGVEHDFVYEIEHKFSENTKSKQLFEP